VDDALASGDPLEAYIWRHVVQDKIPLRWREQVPATPEEERAHAELKTAPSASPAG